MLSPAAEMRMPTAGRFGRCIIHPLVSPVAMTVKVKRVVSRSIGIARMFQLPATSDSVMSDVWVPAAAGAAVSAGGASFVVQARARTAIAELTMSRFMDDLPG